MEVTDPKAIRALAHPVRLDLLELLVAIGPATAAECGRILQLPQANCSFHLRQLAKYGFVTEAEPGPDRRERRYQMPDSRIRIPGNPAVGSELRDVIIGREMQAIADWEQLAGKGPDWQNTGGPVTGVAVMSAAEVSAVKQQLREILEPYFARAAGSGPRLAPGQRYVRYFLAGTPMAELDLNPGHHADKDDHGNEAQGG
jgi:DNA-binding transcriptional ArsR family regulator